MASDPSRSIAGRRVLVTGAARGIGAALAEQLHAHGAHVALAGIEAIEMDRVASRCGRAPWRFCDVRDAGATRTAVDELADALGGLDVVVANAGVSAQVPMVGGDAEAFRRVVEVNVLGVFHTLTAAAPHIAHPGGYAVAVSSLAAAVQAPLLGAYSTSKAAVEALGNTLRVELRPTGARVGVAYFAEMDTDMTRRGYDTEAASALLADGDLTSVSPIGVAVDAMEKGIRRRSRRITAPGWVGLVLPVRMAVQPIYDRIAQKNLAEALAIAAREPAPLTTELPEPAATTDLPRVAEER